MQSQKNTSRNREFHLSSCIGHTLPAKAWLEIFHSKSWHKHLIVLSLHIMTESKIFSYHTTHISVSRHFIMCLSFSLFLPILLLFSILLILHRACPSPINPIAQSPHTRIFFITFSNKSTRRTVCGIWQLTSIDHSGGG